MYPSHQETLTEPIPEKVKKTTVKKSRGQFYTTNSSYILDGMPGPPVQKIGGIRCIIEPFAGKGDLLDWVRQSGYGNIPIEAYDIDPKRPDIVQRDTLTHPPDYRDTWVLTNPPYLARNKSSHKEIYDQYETNDLYKCFLHSVVDQDTCVGGIFIIPAGFFFSPRDIDVRCRHSFMSKYRITYVRYFEETVFDDTTTTIIAVAFEKSAGLETMTEQSVLWEVFPTKQKKTFCMSAEKNWIIGGDIYHLPIPTDIKVRRHVEGTPLRTDEQQTFMTLNALDSGTQSGRIQMEYKDGYVYPAKDCSRTYATLRISGKTLSEEEQIEICRLFNEFLETKREEYWSMFLPQFRESKEYARKRIPFELAYRIVLYVISLLPANNPATHAK